MNHRHRVRAHARLALLLGPALLIATATRAEPAGQPADLCHELLAYADMKARGSSPEAGAPTPPTSPRSTGAAPEATESPHTPEPKQDGGSPSRLETPAMVDSITLQQVRDTARRGDRQACRDATQTLRRAGADLPAPLIALAAYEPDPAKRD